MNSALQFIFLHSIIMPTGTVKKIIADKGFGFIAVEGSADLFFHTKETENFDSLQEGDAVEFQVGQGPKGPNATGVRKAA